MFEVICSECGRDIDDLCKDCMEEIAVSDPNDERLVGNAGGDDE